MQLSRRDELDALRCPRALELGWQGVQVGLDYLRPLAPSARNLVVRIDPRLALLALTQEILECFDGGLRFRFDSRNL